MNDNEILVTADELAFSLQLQQSLLRGQQSCLGPAGIFLSLNSSRTVAVGAPCDSVNPRGAARYFALPLGTCRFSRESPRWFARKKVPRAQRLPRRLWRGGRRGACCRARDGPGGRCPGTVPSVTVGQAASPRASAAGAGETGRPGVSRVLPGRGELAGGPRRGASSAASGGPAGCGAARLSPPPNVPGEQPSLEPPTSRAVPASALRGQVFVLPLFIFWK